MTQKIIRDLAPSLLLACGIVAAQSAQSTWSALAGTLLLALALLAADALATRLHGTAARPSIAAMILAVACVFAGSIALLREPGHAASLIPVFGLGAWVVLFMPGGSRRSACVLNGSSRSRT
ncbi:MAG: hypothetical protein ABIT64_00780 [Lysobacteraceae bacterium]